MKVDKISRWLEIEQSAAATIPPRDANNFTIGNAILFLKNIYNAEVYTTMQCNAIN